MNHYVYKIINTINNKKYIGKRSCNCSIKEDKYMGSGVALNNAFRKYGKTKFKKEIIEICNSEEEAFSRERYWIKHFNAVESRDFYNIKDGGEGNTREDMLRYLNNMTEEQRRIRSYKLSLANKGENNSMYGKVGKDNPVSKPIVMIDSKGNLIKAFECVREANDYFGNDRAYSLISRICINKKGSAYNYLWLFKNDYEDLIKSNSFTEWLTVTNGKIVTMLNNKMNDNYIDTINTPVYQLDKENLEIIARFENIKMASIALNIVKGTILSNVRHKRNSAGGYAWISVKEYHSISREKLQELYRKKVSPIKSHSRPKSRIKIICLNTLEVFDQQSDAVKHFNLCAGANISAVCRGTRKSSGKHPITGEPLRWMYYSDYLKRQELLDEKEIC